MEAPMNNEQPTIRPDAVYTQAEACRLLRLGRVSLLRLRKRGDLGYVVSHWGLVATWPVFADSHAAQAV